MAGHVAVEAIREALSQAGPVAVRAGALAFPQAGSLRRVPSCHHSRCVRMGAAGRECGAAGFEIGGGCAGVELLLVAWVGVDAGGEEAEEEEDMLELHGGGGGAVDSDG